MKATDDELEATLQKLRLFGLLARLDEIRNKPWLKEVIAIELEEKTRRSLAHRNHIAGIGPFKPVSSFDWKWPRKIDRALVEELFDLDFVREGANVVLLGPNGVGKTMLLRNLADRALQAGHAVVVRAASDLLADLTKQESARRQLHPPINDNYISPSGSSDRVVRSRRLVVVVHLLAHVVAVGAVVVVGVTVGGRSCRSRRSCRWVVRSGS